MFEWLLLNHIGDTKRKSFRNYTNLSFSVYYRMMGNKGGGLADNLTLLKVSYGLGLSYKEAVVLFAYYGRLALHNDEDNMAEITEILFELNNIHEPTGLGRIAELQKLCKKHNIVFK